MAARNNYYAYVLPDGRSGVAESWVECERLVSGRANARYKGFRTREEAQSWLHNGAQYEVKVKPKIEKGIYFDAGTGRGKGVEVSVTDENGKNLLHLVLPKNRVNKFGKLNTPTGVTNNYGELLGLFYALRVAKKRGVQHIFGDSALVINFWSKGIMKEKELPVRTKKLVREVAVARTAFETGGGEIDRISGDWNPADLGFH